jgi:hypothetical protein
MEPQEHREPDPGPERTWPSGDDVLRNLEARLDQASQAAERLLAEATARAAAAGLAGNATDAGATGATGDSGAAGKAGDGPPAAGWQAPESEARSSSRDLELLIGLIGSMRDLVPPELQQRLALALRELLLALRALIDWYLERAERRSAAPSEVQDIPIQ